MNENGQSFTSVFSRAFDFGNETVKRKVSRQVDLDKSITHQIRTMLSQYNMNTLINSVNRSPLMLFQYSSPAAADVFKHYHTIAHLKLAMHYSDLKDLEKGQQADLDYLRDQAEIECIKEKLSRGSFEGDLIDLMVNCRDIKLNKSGVFAHLNYSHGQRTINIFEKVFNRLNFRGEEKKAILEILPKWEINPDGYHMQGPSKRIGQVLSENHQKFMDQLEDVLKEYRQEKTVSADSLIDFSMPGISFTEQYIRDLLAIDENERLILINHLAAQLAFVKTIRDYDLAIEWSRRALTHPSIEEAYKNVVRKGVIFLKQEEVSLKLNRQQLNQHDSVTKSLLGVASTEKLNSIVDTEHAKQGKERWRLFDGQ
jgi:hypothetical protein